jgi:hypothetical protein
LISSMLKRTFIIEMLIEFILWSIDASPAFIHYITNELNKAFM